MVSKKSKNMISSLKNTYTTGLRTERKHLPSFVSSLVKHMHGRGIASSRRAIVLNLHFLRWSAMLAMLANFHSFTVPKAVLNRHTWMPNNREMICYLFCCNSVELYNGSTDKTIETQYQMCFSKTAKNITYLVCDLP